MAHASGIFTFQKLAVSFHTDPDPATSALQPAEKSATCIGIPEKSMNLAFPQGLKFGVNLFAVWMSRASLELIVFSCFQVSL